MKEYMFYVILVLYQMTRPFFLLVVGSTTITAKYVVSTSYVSPVLKLLYVEFYFLSMCSQSTIICNDLLA